MKNKEPGKITGAKATGSFVLVEMLTEAEASGSKLVTSQKPSLQGYVVDVGPALESEKWGLKKGNRVLLQGSYVPVPVKSSEGRELGICDAHTIKCVLEE